MRVALIWERKVDGKKSGSAFPIMSFVNKLLSSYFLQQNKQSKLVESSETAAAGSASSL